MRKGLVPPPAKHKPTKQVAGERAWGGVPSMYGLRNMRLTLKNFLGKPVEILKLRYQNQSV